MSLADTFLSTARDILMMSENIKRMESRLDTVTADLAGVDRRLMKMELMIEISKQAPRKRAAKELP